MDLYNQLMDLSKQLDISIKQLRYTGQDFAQATQIYRMKLSEELLKLEAEGRPVTNLMAIARGKPEVAKAKYDEIAKEAIHKANLESVQGIKMQIKILQAIIDKEWSNS